MKSKKSTDTAFIKKAKSLHFSTGEHPVTCADCGKPIKKFKLVGVGVGICPIHPGHADAPDEQAFAE